MLHLKAHRLTPRNIDEPPTLHIALPLIAEFRGGSSHPSRPVDLPRRVPVDVTVVEIGRHPDRSRESFRIGPELFLPIPLHDVNSLHLRIDRSDGREHWIAYPLGPVLYKEGFSDQWRSLDGPLELTHFHALTLGPDYRQSPIITVVINGPTFHSRRHPGQDLTW